MESPTNRRMKQKRRRRGQNVPDGRKGMKRGRRGSSGTWMKIWSETKTDPGGGSERVLLVGAGIGNIRRNNVKRRSYREERRDWKIQRIREEEGTWLERKRDTGRDKVEAREATKRKREGERKGGRGRDSAMRRG